MPTRCTEAGTCSGIRNSCPPGRTHAGKPDKTDRTSGPEQAPPSKPSRSSKLPKPECATEPPSGYARRGTPFALAWHLPFRPGRIFKPPADRSLCSQSIHVRALGQAECCRAGPGDRHTLQEFRLAWPSFRRMPRYYRRLYVYCVE